MKGDSRSLWKAIDSGVPDDQISITGRGGGGTRDRVEREQVAGHGGAILGDFGRAVENPGGVIGGLTKGGESEHPTGLAIRES